MINADGSFDIPINQCTGILAYPVVWYFDDDLGYFVVTSCFVFDVAALVFRASGSCIGSDAYFSGGKTVQFKLELKLANEPDASVAYTPFSDTFFVLILEDLCPLTFFSWANSSLLLAEQDYALLSPPTIGLSDPDDIV